MGSRLGSLIVLVALGVIVAVAALLVSRFSGGSDGDQPTLVVSLVQDQPVLLGEPLEVEVRARSGVPISIVALLVEGIIASGHTGLRQRAGALHGGAVLEAEGAGLREPEDRGDGHRWGRRRRSRCAWT